MPRGAARIGGCPTAAFLRHGGRLVARVRRSGITFLYQYFAPDDRKRFWPLGPFDPQGERGLSLPQARDRAAGLSALYRSGVHDLHAHFEGQRVRSASSA